MKGVSYYDPQAPPISPFMTAEGHLRRGGLIVPDIKEITKMFLRKSLKRGFFPMQS